MILSMTIFGWVWQQLWVWDWSSTQRQQTLPHLHWLQNMLGWFDAGFFPLILLPVSVPQWWLHRWWYAAMFFCILMSFPKAERKILYDDRCLTVFATKFWTIIFCLAMQELSIEVILIPNASHIDACPRFPFASDFDASGNPSSQLLMRWELFGEV